MLYLGFKYSLTLAQFTRSNATNKREAYANETWGRKKGAQGKHHSANRLRSGELTADITPRDGYLLPCTSPNVSWCIRTMATWVTNSLRRLPCAKIFNCFRNQRENPKSLREKHQVLCLLVKKRLWITTYVHQKKRIFKWRTQVLF